MDEVEQALGRNSANLGQWLANRCKARQGVFSRHDVVKANHRNIGRHTQIEVLKRADGTDRVDVVEGDQRSKRQLGSQQLLYDRIAQLRGAHVAVEADDQFRLDLQTQSLRNCQDPIPARIRVGAERLPTHERDLPVPKSVQVIQG